MAENGREWSADDTVNLAGAGRNTASSGARVHHEKPMPDTSVRFDADGTDASAAAQPRLGGSGSLDVCFRRTSLGCSEDQRLHWMDRSP